MYPLVFLIVFWVKFPIFSHFSKILQIFEVKSHICVQYKSSNDLFGFGFIRGKLYKINILIFL